MAVSKVILNDETLMDVTQDSVTASTLLSGETATGANGVRLTGTATVPEPSSTTPAMDGTAAVGTATTYARADHVHPTDTSRADASAIENATFSSGIISTWITPRATLLATLNSLNSGKQAKLVSGTNIKTINGASILGSGDIATPTYTLPTASTSTLGGVKVDGSTITITDGVISSSGGGGGGDAYVIGMTLSGTTVSNVTYPTGESATTIATAIMDDPSTRVVFSIDVGANHGVMNCTPCSLQASAYPAYGDEATSIDAVMPMWYEDRGGDRKTYLLRLMLYGGNWSAQTRTTI